MRKNALVTALFTDQPLARNVLLWASLLACGVVLALVGRHPHSAWLLVLAVPVLCLSLLDLTQTTHSLRRTFPVSARFRWMFEWLRPFLHSYIVEGGGFEKPSVFEAFYVIPFLRFWLREWRYETAWFF
ncbi:hypothetical protein [Acetobacter vaccinii]|uniref:Uncharacterized protein n=1 Tax=Acetobacter vaccinii TaxID=2592655 RepID=A0A5C1YPS2_9PROT|nr:hypothetical protein [Acetobacter vaccinii]QEO17538.1 hypothetical protein FLP30_07235 [Acetobacter vaccinii]